MAEPQEVSQEEDLFEKEETELSQEEAEMLESMSDGYFTLVDTVGLSHEEARRLVNDWGHHAEEEAWMYYRTSGASMEQVYGG